MIGAITHQQMRHEKRECEFPIAWIMALAAFLLLEVGTVRAGNATPAGDAGVAVGPQYDSTHVYVAPGDLTLSSTASLPRSAGSRPSDL